jgi:hypothetical protein
MRCKGGKPLGLSGLIGPTVGFRAVNILSEVETRVLGSLIEKQFTTPDYCPLSLNAIVDACNQRSNRDPVLLQQGAACAAHPVGCESGITAPWKRYKP